MTGQSMDVDHDPSPEDATPEPVLSHAHEILQPSALARTKGSETPYSKRWSIFGYTSSPTPSIKESTPKAPHNTLFERRGDVYIEPEDHNTEAERTTTATAGSTHGATGPTTTSPEAQAALADTLANVKTEIAAPSEPGQAAPAVVGVSELNVIAPRGTIANDKAFVTVGGTMSSSYSWLSIIPGLGSKSDINMILTQDAEDVDVEQKDGNGNTANQMEPKAGRTFAQLTEARSSTKSSPLNVTPGEKSKEGQTFAQQKEIENNESSTLGKEMGKAAASLSKVILRKKNIILPNYYDQFPDIHKGMFSWHRRPRDEDPQSPTSPRGTHERSQSIVKNAVSALSNLFSRGSSAPSSPAVDSDAFHRGTKGIKKVAIFGIHGWFPTKLVRSVIGEPTGTSKKFCDEMDAALKDYLKQHDVELDDDDITLIPLEGEGKVMDRVNLLYENLTKHETWTKTLQEADLVLVATHSQGTPTSILLVARLIQEGMLRVEEDDHKMQRIGILTMAGISHGPFPFLKGNFVVRWFEAEAAGELFEFMDSETEIAKKFREALRVVLSSGVRLTCVASLEDQVVPLYSAVMTSVSHPSIVRAVYIDGCSYQDDFLTNLISFTLRLRNSGVEDHGVLVHLSEVVAGSIYGEGHSTIYEEREVYQLAIRSLLEPPASLTSELARSEPVLNPFQARERLNPFYLPWGMRGVVDDIQARGDRVLTDELERLKELYDDWNPVSKAMKEIKFRLEPIVGHAGIGKRRLASHIRNGLGLAPVTTTPPPSTSPDTITPSSPPPRIRPTTASNTDISFRTAETLPFEDSPNQISSPSSRLPVLRSYAGYTPADKPTPATATTESLTAPEVVESTARYDLILFMVSISNQDSWEDCKKYLQQLDPAWFFGRCAIVVTQVTAVARYAFDREDISNHLRTLYDIPVMWTNLDHASDARATASAIIRMLELNGYRRRGGNRSLASLSASLALPGEVIPTTTQDSTGAMMGVSALPPSFGLYIGSNIGSRATTSFDCMRTAATYNISATTLPSNIAHGINFVAEDE
ncbi:hypothetical protein BG005_005538 [Podila minutissima]|nr:hypothetical protein BG005_005538 [Podila minutissima]